MVANRRPMLFAVLMALVVALPAVAEVYEVTLRNGTKFETRYQPQVADWDESKMLLTTGQGNRISLAIADVESITADTEIKGFGTVIKTGTIALGWAPNDAPVPEEAMNEGRPVDQVIDFLRQQNQPAPAFNTQQFAEPTIAGSETTGGIPLGFVNTNTPPLGVVVGGDQGGSGQGGGGQ